MRFRYVLPLLVASALALAYASPSPSHPFDSMRRGVVRDTIAASLDIRVTDDVKFNLHITNSSPKRVELRFANGQTHDLVVLDPQGREVWRWSHGRMFTQAMQNKMLASTDTLTFSEIWHPEHAGSYTVVASLLSENYPLEERVQFAFPSKTVSAR